MGALAEAIKAYGGGVVMITHNKEFYSALTQVRKGVGKGGWVLDRMVDRNTFEWSMRYLRRGGSRQGCLELLV